MNVIRGSIFKLAYSEINFNTDGLNDIMQIVKGFLYQKLNNKSIRQAVHMWYSNKNEALKIHGHISSWDTSKVTNMCSLFYYHIRIDDDISKWNTSRVTNMKCMFQDATYFNQEIGNWDVRNVKNMACMFKNAKSFNKNINNWNVSNVTNTSFMFYNAYAFKQTIAKWEINKYTKIVKMFEGAVNFNKLILFDLKLDDIQMTSLDIKFIETIVKFDLNKHEKIVEMLETAEDFCKANNIQMTGKDFEFLKKIRNRPPDRGLDLYFESTRDYYNC